MEDTLREKKLGQTEMEKYVLILVLMEDTLRERNKRFTKNLFSLNPCFNGRYSQRYILTI